MGERVEFDGTHIRVLDENDIVIWSDEQRPINLLPDAYTITASVDMQFPDMDKSWAHRRSRVDIGGGIFRTACFCYTTYKPSLEWGPGEGGGFNLANATLGTVPSGVNYLEVRVTLARTVAPHNYMGIAIPNALSTEETILPGGSMDLEVAPAWWRGAKIFLSGTSVLLSRHQTVGSDGLVVPATDTSPYGANTGWTRPASEADDRRFIHFVTSAGPNANTNYYNDGYCPPDTSQSWAARWQGTAVIRPGYVDA